MKRLQWLLIAIVTLSIVLLAAAFFVINSINLNEYKVVLEKELNRATGLTTTIKGRVGFQWFPSVAIRLNDIEITDTNQPALQHIGSITQLSAELRLLPLFYGQLHIKKTIASGLHLFVNRLKRPATASPPPLSSSAQSLVKPNKKSPNKHLSRLQLAQLELNNATLTMGEAANETLLSIKQLKASTVRINHDFPLVIVAAVSKHRGATHLPFAFKGVASFNFSSPSATLLDALTLSGNLQIRKAVHHAFTLDKLDGKLSLKKQQLHIAPLTMALYAGTGQGWIKANLATKKIRLQQSMKGLQLAKMLGSNKTLSVVSGTLDFQLTASMQAKNQRELLNSLSSKGQLHLKNGQLLTQDITAAIDWITHLASSKLSFDELVSQLHALKDREQFTKKSTAFEQLTAPFIIERGIMRMPSLTIVNKKIRILGQGNVDLNTRQLDYHLNAQLRSANGELLTIQNALGGHFPLHLSGSLTKPTLLPAVAAIVKELGRRIVRQQLNHVKQRLQRELKKIDFKTVTP